jgi:hypothetical protein
MTRTTSVSSHTRRLPEKAPDPFAPVMEAKRPDYARWWGVELVGSNDSRLSVPVADPVPGPGQFNIEDHNPLMRTLAKLVGWKG